MVCDPSVGGRVIRHAESFRRGIARLSFVVPRTAKLVRVKLTIALGHRAATRISSFRVRPLPKPSLSIADVSIVEGDTGTRTLAFPVRLSAATTRTVSVDYWTADDTAASASDYAATRGTVTFAPGKTTQTIKVTIAGDTLVEPDETFMVVLSAPVNATRADYMATGTIRNDDSTSLSIGDAWVAEGNTGTTALSFPVTLTAASTATVSVRYATADGTATSADDYVAASGVLTFSPGETARTLSISIKLDITVEEDETFTLVLSDALNARLEDGTATGTIRNDDTTPRLEITGPEELVYDWSTEHCADFDMPDLPARAIRSADGEVQLYLAGLDNRRLVGPDLNHLHHDCTPAFVSHLNDDPAAFDDMEWLAAPYTTDGRTVYSLVHMEHSLAGPPNYDALTLAVSTDGGRTYQHAAPPAHLVASSPDRDRYLWWGSFQGMSGPSNIVRGPDGYYYAFAMVNEDVPPQTSGTCLLRTSDLADPHAWRGWRSDRGWNVTFVNPYLETVTDRAAHICEPLPGLAEAIKGGFVASSLTYNTYLERYVFVTEGSAGDARPDGFYFTTSVDLVHWTPAQLIAPEPLAYTRTCPNTDPVQYVSLLDPESTSPSFETAGQTAYLYYSRYPCGYVLQHDLLRVPVRFTK